MSISDLIPVTPVAPAAPYLGGKRNLSRRIIARLGAVPHGSYIEPFVGMGGIFLRRPFRARAEAINDSSRDVANLFRILQRHYVPLMDMLRWQLTSRAEFDRLRAAGPETLTDLERAARFLYLQRLAFGGKVTGRSFGTSPSLPGRFDVTKLGPALEAIHDRLSGVTIEALPWRDFLRRYGVAGALAYLDPPYFGCEADYGAGAFTRGEFAELAEHLAGCRHAWLMSINDDPEIRRLFAGFVIEEVATTWTISGEKQPVKELLISPAPS